MFITFEGVRGCGKSTQAELLAENLNKSGYQILNIPSNDNEVACEVGRIIVNSETKGIIKPMTELLLLNAAQAQMIDETILPAVEAGKIVICQDFIDSTLVYGSYIKSIDPDVVRTLNGIVLGYLVPNLTILIDISGETMAERFGISEQMKRHYSVLRIAYLEIAAAEPQRFIIVDGNRDKDKIAQDIWTAVSRILFFGTTTGFLQA